MLKWEADTYSELEGNINYTFLFELHEHGIWDLEAYNLFIFKCSNLLEYYHKNGQTPDTQEVLRLFTDRFAFIASLIFCHFSGIDAFTINNWNELLENEIIPGFFDTYRQFCTMLFFE